MKQPVFAGLDLGGTNVRCGRVHIDENGMPSCQKARLRPLGTRDFYRVLDIICEEIQALGPVDGVGVAVAGMVDASHRLLVRAPNLDWSDVQLAREIENACGVPVVVLNDVNAITWGEYLAMGRPDVADMLAVFFGTGVGGGLVAGGNLVEGARGQALEIGHVLADPSPDAPLCGCGRQGCLEAFVGGLNFSHWIRGQCSAPVAHMGVLDEMARRRDPQAAGLVERLAAMTARALGDAVILLDPGLLMAGGTVWDGCPFFASQVRALVDRRCPGAVQWVSPQLGIQAGVVGAGAFAWRVLSGRQP